MRRVTQQETHGMLSENKKKKCVKDLAVFENDQWNLKSSIKEDVK